ncbi:MAG: response regulator [Actinobacteria bacterium]|nr:MAG: response regulator [Actinomycetota bacterium]
MELDPAPLPLVPILEHGVAMVRERAGRSGISLTLEIDPSVGSVMADELKLKQVVLNLLTNAVKFTGAGGSVVVTARQDDDAVEVTVRDTGTGIAEADRERIFEAFQRGGRDVRTSTEGTGLGLTLSKRIVELHGGRLWMESEVGVGSVFGFSLPVTTAVAPVVAPPIGAPAIAHDRRTVVVIDDDPLDLELVEAVLAPEGYNVVRASSGEQGVALVRHEQPLVVLLDLMMPDMDGFEVAERLRAEPETADVPIIVLTHKEMTRADRDRLAGRVSHLAQKGELDRAALVAVVGRLADARTSEREGVT